MTLSSQRMQGMQPLLLLAVAMVAAVEWSASVGSARLCVAAAFVPLGVPQPPLSPSVVTSEHQERTQRRQRPQRSPLSQLYLAAPKRQAPADMGYTVQVSKPLGVVFGENRPPFLGLVVDDVEPGLNGGAVGMRAGDNLLTVNGQSVIGMDFDQAMDILKAAPSKSVQLQLYRGPVRTMYQVLEGRLGPLEQAEEDDDDGDDGSEAVVMDESYVSPVVIPIDQEEEGFSFTPGQLFGALFGSPQETSDEEDDGAPPPPAPKQSEAKKSGGGLFGMFGGGETIQLEGEDATGYKALKLTEKEQQEADSMPDDPLSGLKTLGNMLGSKKQKEDDTPPSSGRKEKG